VVIDPQIISRLKKDMPESISSKRERYIKDFGITSQVADVLSSDKFYSDLFEQAHDQKNAKEIANFITTDLMGFVDTKEKRKESKLTAKHLADLANSIIENKITRNSSKNVLQTIVKSGKSVSQLISELDLGHVSDEVELSKIIDEVLKDESKAVEEAKQKPETINYLVGKVMKKTKGKADATLTLSLLKKKIS